MRSLIRRILRRSEPFKSDTPTIRLRLPATVWDAPPAPADASTEPEPDEEEREIRNSLTRTLDGAPVQ